MATVAIVGLWRSIPGGDNPFIGFGLNHGLGVHTRAKLAELQSMPDQCQLALSRSQLEYTAIPDRQEGDFCAFEGVVRMDESQVDYSSPAQVTCPLAAALYVWEREVLQPLAREHLGAEVRRIQHVGTYACRRVYGGRLGEPSQHARANAIDMIGFTLDDGGAVSVVNHWDDSGAKGSFLRRLHASRARFSTGCWDRSTTPIIAIISTLIWVPMMSASDGRDHFGDRLARAIRVSGPLCVGIDPYPKRMPALFGPPGPEAIERFSLNLIDALQDECGGGEAADRFV